jgi:hypothetical protein
MNKIPHNKDNSFSEIGFPLMLEIILGRNVPMS